MGKYASGKFAKRISDRSGMAFPYNEMVQEWTWFMGSLQVSLNQNNHSLEPLPMVTDPQSLDSMQELTSSKIQESFVGGALGPINAGRTVARPATGDDASYDGAGFGLTSKSVSNP